MPELPEVHTTVTGLSKTIVGQTINSVWTDYNSPYFKGSNTIKDPVYFKYFKKEVEGMKIVSVTRRAKNILINIVSKENLNKTILIHMKMTGHIILGHYLFTREIKKKRPNGKLNGVWSPAPDERIALHDPYNRFIHFVISLSNGKQVVLCDTRKFAKVTLLETDSELQTSNNKNRADNRVKNPKSRTLISNLEALYSISEHLKDLGPEPLDRSFTFEAFKNHLNKKPNGKIKTVLMDQTIISGIGNIYSDEALWRASIHPMQLVRDTSEKKLIKLYSEIKIVLEKGIDFGGDSMSDYRNIDGERGKFQEQHQVYRKKGEKCSFVINDETHRSSHKVCTGIIQRIVVGGRSAHFCPIHQKLQP